MTRRSSRLQAKAETAGSTIELDESKYDVSAEEDKSECTDLDDGKAEAPPARKKRKTNPKANAKPKARPASKQAASMKKTASFDPKWRHTRGRRGLLKQLATDAPLDILFEIFSHLEPTDLLHLIRSCKELRSLLLGRSSAGVEAIWRSARSNIDGLPNIPPTMSEPSFAALFFDTFCMKCLAPHASTYMYQRRLCQNCFAADCCNPWILSSPLSNFPDKDEFVPFCSSYGSPGDYLPTYSALLGGRYRYVSGISHDEARQLIEDVAEQPEECRKERLTMVAKEKTMKLSFTKSCREWANLRIANRADELESLRDKRYNQILDRLKALGLTEWLNKMEVDDLRTFQNLKVVKKPQEITDRIWNNIQGELIPFIENVKKKGIAKGIYEARQTRIAVLEEMRREYALTVPAEVVLPQVIDILLVPPFGSIIEKDVASERDFSKDDLSNAWLRFPEIADKWRIKAMQHLLRSTKLQHEHELSLALNTFMCRICQGCVDAGECLPRVLHHNCRSARLSHQDINSLPMKERLIETLNLRPFKDSRFEVIKQAKAPELLHLCGLDPDKATHQDVMSLNPLFECETCFRDAGWNDGRLFMNYPEALHHDRQCYGSSTSLTPRIRHVRPDELTSLAISEDQFPRVARLEPFWSPDTAGWLCRHCTASFSTSQLTQHMTEHHEISYPKHDIDYTINYAGPYRPRWLARRFRMKGPQTDEPVQSQPSSMGSSPSTV